MGSRNSSWRKCHFQEACKQPVCHIRGRYEGGKSLYPVFISVLDLYTYIYAHRQAEFQKKINLGRCNFFKLATKFSYKPTGTKKDPTLHLRLNTQHYPTTTTTNRIQGRVLSSTLCCSALPERMNSNYFLPCHPRH